MLESLLFEVTKVTKITFEKTKKRDDYKIATLLDKSATDGRLLLSKNFRKKILAERKITGSNFSFLGTNAR